MTPSDSRTELPPTASDLASQAGFVLDGRAPGQTFGVAFTAAGSTRRIEPNTPFQPGPEEVQPRPWARIFPNEALPAWLVSVCVHTILFILLVLWNLPPGAERLSIVVRLADSERDFESEVITEVPETQIVVEESIEPAVATELATNAPDTEVLEVVSPLPKAAESVIEPSELVKSFTPVSGQEVMAIQLPKGGIYRRDAAARVSLGAKYGATPESEDAVEAALRWLAAHQQRDGSWSFDLSQEPCNGQCRNSHNDESLPRPATAATGLALLAFLGAGYNHHEGKYQTQVQRGLYFLREEANEANAGYDLQGGSMYGHGIAMLAISEAMAMTRYLGKQDTDLFTLAQKGSQFTAAAQHSLGGWRYVPGSPGDMTVTAWQVLSLISAQHGGVLLPTDSLARAERFVRGLSKPGAYSFGYQSIAAERTTTAVGLCTLMYLGQTPHEEAFGKAMDQLAKRGPKLTDVYHDYYATLAMHHARHPAWQAWHVPLREHLVKTQSTKGHEAGSWHFADKNGDVGGRLYTTAMCAMTLEIYYRYLPLYQTRDEFKLD